MNTNNNSTSYRKGPRNNYFNNVPIRHGELTVVTSDHAEATMRHSSRLAATIQKAGLGVLLLNCGMSSRRFREHFNMEHEQVYTEPRLILHSTAKGNLASEREAIDQFLRQGYIGVLIITGWEFASDSYLRRQRLLTYLRELMEEQELTIIIYAHTSREPVAGKLDSGGLGKLTLLAVAVAKIDSSEILEVAAPKTPPIVGTAGGRDEAMREAYEFVREINKLPGIGKREAECYETSKAA